jgi:signal transduction histidine kinase
MNDYFACCPDTGVVESSERMAYADPTDAQAIGGIPEAFQLNSNGLADHLRLWPLWLRGQELGAANGQKNEFMAVLSHELRNSLGAIRSAAWILRMEISAGPAAVKARMVIERQVAQMGRLVEDLLDVSRARNGQLALLPERIDLCAVAARAAQAVAVTMQERNQLLSSSFPDTPVWLEADPARLEQVFVNLLFNAAKYTDSEGHIALSVVREDGDAVVRVRDTGIGIDPKVLPYVFDLFVQADPSSRRSEAGLGIGLALVRSLVERHGGRVTAASAGRGHGSEFTVRLPTQAEGRLPLDSAASQHGASQPVSAGQDTHRVIPHGRAANAPEIDRREHA